MVEWSEVQEEAAKTLRPVHAPRLSYIYTSGIVVHGDSRKEIVTDTTPLTSLDGTPISWRPALEKRVLTNSTLNGIVIRPPTVYGRSGAQTALYFKAAHDGKVKWFGSANDRMSFVHCDDLADLYVLAAEKAPLVGGQAFDAANSFQESIDDVMWQPMDLQCCAGMPNSYANKTNFPREGDSGYNGILCSCDLFIIPFESILGSSGFDKACQ